MVVRQIYDLAIGRHGPTLGVKAIVNRLNGEGITFRGKPFHISSVHRILTSRTYIGEHVFNRRCAKTGESKPSADWIISTVPAIIDEADFELIHANLEARDPKRTPPRVVSGPTLLTGIARCGSCDSGMTIRTGKSGRYRYYVCAGCAQKGKTFCAGRSVSMPKLDRAVTTHLAEHLFNKDRLRVILQAYLEQSDQMRADRTRRGSILKTRQTEISGKIGRLLQMVANGIMESDDPDLADQTRQLKAQRHQVSEELMLLEQSSSATDTALTESRLARFADVMKAAMASEDPAFRKAYLRLFVDTVTVNDAQIKLTGPKAALAKAAGQDSLPAAAAVVPSFVRAWRPRRDSNPRPLD